MQIESCKDSRKKCQIILHNKASYLYNKDDEEVNDEDHFIVEAACRKTRRMALGRHSRGNITHDGLAHD